MNFTQDNGIFNLFEQLRVPGKKRLSKKKTQMIMKKNQHVTPKNGEWQVKGAGNEKATRIVPTQKEDIKIAKNIAQHQKTEVVIHGRNGQIRDKDSYGNDPVPPIDTKH